ncbi:hypothetical protein COV18_03770 [Candidatus Woesearchaeota archaeon CG10_big_fil_rev_8_21_14_0_10_37_12]|nr:MAG: hypothetical protein COV18_03770 [Candidatus Woesearchaeota archaeon CG10_big_fil_rev_8_21_14_0_10_37_12]
MEYIDANVFIFACLNDGSKGDVARTYLREIVEVNKRAATSALTIDEVFHVIWKKTSDRSLAVRECERILKISNLEILPMDKHIIQVSITLLKENAKLDPRDAIHYATIIKHEIKEIISDDKDFEGISGIKRISLD